MNRTWASVIELIGGRKFLVFLAGTALVCTKIIDQNTWLWVVGFYIGGNIADTLANKVSLNLGAK